MTFCNINRVLQCTHAAILKPGLIVFAPLPSNLQRCTKRPLVCFSTLHCCIWCSSGRATSIVYEFLPAWDGAPCGDSSVVHRSSCCECTANGVTLFSGCLLQHRHCNTASAIITGSTRSTGARGFWRLMPFTANITICTPRQPMNVTWLQF